MCVEGEVEVSAGGYTEALTTGGTMILPAKTDSIVFNSNNAKLLEVYID